MLHEDLGYKVSPQPWQKDTGFTLNNLILLKRAAKQLGLKIPEKLDEDPETQLRFCEQIIGTKRLDADKLHLLGGMLDFANQMKKVTNVQN